MNCFHSTLIADWQKPLSRIKLVETRHVGGCDCQSWVDNCLSTGKLSQKAMYNCHESRSKKDGSGQNTSKYGFCEDLPSLYFLVCRAAEVPDDEIHGFLGTSSKSSLQSSMDFLALRVAPESHVPRTETLQQLSVWNL